MKHTVSAITAVASLILFTGAGCASTSPSVETKPAVTQEATDLQNNILADNAAPTIPVTKKSDTGLTVTAESTDVGTLIVNLDVAENLTKEVDVYRLMLSNQPNPIKTTPGQWYELGPGHLKKIWLGLPSGKRHLRACVIKNNECTVFSNDLEVTIK